MTFTLKTSGEDGAKEEEVETAEQAAEKFAQVREDAETIKIHIDSEAAAPDDLTESERLIIEKEAKSAAAKGESSEDCPYRDEGERRTLWLDAFHEASR